ncbi:MAG: hypothetical protein ACRD9R_24520, partial [Pyrinomonadaceae bacterium]
FRLGILNTRAGDYRAAATLFGDAIRFSNDRHPAGRNNLGVILALMGRYREAEREFEIALRQEDGSYEDARLNLALCRSRLKPENLGQLALTSATAPRRRLKGE